MQSKVKAEATTSRIAALATALLLLLLSASAASAATITVDDSGGADYTNVYAAVNIAIGAISTTILWRMCGIARTWRGRLLVYEE